MKIGADSNLKSVRTPDLQIGAGGVLQIGAEESGRTDLTGGVLLIDILIGAELPETSHLQNP